MPTLFLVITAFNMACLAGAAGLGYLLGGADTTQWHPLAGVAAVLICVCTHCIVFTYFIATAKWIQHAVSVRSLDEQLLAPTRSFKMQALPAALLAMAATFATAISGAASVNYFAWPVWHHVLSWAALAINLLVALVEYRAIVRNGRLIDDILARMTASAA
jgi:hypothetical protein